MTGNLKLPDGDQTGRHIHSQCSESDFINTKDYQLGGSNEDFEIPEENSSERASSFRS